MSEFSLWLRSQEDEMDNVSVHFPLDDSRKFAKASGKFPMNKKQTEEISKLLHQKIEQIEREMVSKWESPYEIATIHGAFDSVLKKGESTLTNEAIAPQVPRCVRTITTT